METLTLNKVEMSAIAGRSTTIPNSGGKQFTNFGIPVVGPGALAFYGGTEDHHGIYLKETAEGAHLKVVCDLSTALPTIGTPTSINETPCIADGGVYFAANNGVTQGIYKYDISTAEIGEIYVCANSEKLSQFSASRGYVSFEKSNSVNVDQNGIWLIEKDNLAKLVVTAGTPVQISGRPMDGNNLLYRTGAPRLDGVNLAFIGELKNCATGHVGQAMIRYSIVGGGLLSVLKDGSLLPDGNQLVGGNPFKSELSYRHGLITANVEYNTIEDSSTMNMVIGVNAQNAIFKIATNDHVGPIIYTNEFAMAPMSSGGQIAFVSAVELESDRPSLNLFGWNTAGHDKLETLIEGYAFPYGGKSYLQSIDQVGDSFYGSMIAGRCFWNDGYTDNEDLLGIYVFHLEEEV